MRSTATKLLVALMVLCMLLCFTACGTAGTYTLSGATMDGTTYDTEALEEMEIDLEECYVTLNSDGKGEFCLFGEEVDIGWEDGEMWLADNEDDVIEYELDGKTLTLEYDGSELVFTK